MTEVEDRRLVGDVVASELEPRESAHRLDIVERFLRARFGQAVSLLQTVDAQHRRERERSPSAMRTHFRIMGIDQRFRRRPPHHGRHLGLEQIPLHPLLLSRKIKRREARMIVHRSPFSNQPQQCAMIRGISEIPKDSRSMVPKNPTTDSLAASRSCNTGDMSAGGLEHDGLARRRYLDIMATRTGPQAVSRIFPIA